MKTNKEIKMFDSISDAFKYLNKNYYNTSITDVCNGKCQNFVGYKWKWYTE